MTKTTILWNNDFVELKEVEDGSAGIAIATSNYIPIDSFKEAFMKAAELNREKSWSTFIFDKSKLDTFHQPSMEWYYTEWKKELAESGLNKHLKILPDLPWFKSSVDAGIHEIKSKHPNFDFGIFTVNYVDDMESAIVSAKKGQ